MLEIEGSNPSTGTFKMNEHKIIKGLIELLEKLISSPKDLQEKVANEISSYAEKNLKNNLPEDVEELLVHCLDLDHWGWEELPPTLTIDDIKREFLPEVRKILVKYKK